MWEGKFWVVEGVVVHALRCLDLGICLGEEIVEEVGGREVLATSSPELASCGREEVAAML